MTETNNPNNRIRALRLAKKPRMTQEDLATAIGTNTQNIQRLETGARALTHAWMVMIAQGLGVEPWELIIDRQSLLDTLAKEMSRHASLIKAYTALDEQDRQIVDRILFGKESVVHSASK